MQYSFLLSSASSTLILYKSQAHNILKYCSDSFHEVGFLQNYFVVRFLPRTAHNLTWVTLEGLVQLVLQIYCMWYLQAKSSPKSALHLRTMTSKQTLKFSACRRSNLFYIISVKKDKIISVIKNPC